LVRRTNSAEEAYRRGEDIAALENYLDLGAPDERAGGRRRVVVRVYSWVIDEEFKLGYDPEWLKVADDMSVKRAVAYVVRWAKNYDRLLQKGLESRFIKWTQLEIAFWTMGQATRTV